MEMDDSDANPSEDQDDDQDHNLHDDDNDEDEDDDQSSGEPISSMGRKRRRNNGGKAVSSSSSSRPTTNDGQQRLRPSRSSRFQGSMKEPSSESVRDLFVGSTTHQRINHAKATSTTTSSSRLTEKDQEDGNEKNHSGRSIRSNANKNPKNTNANTNNRSNRKSMRRRVSSPVKTTTTRRHVKARKVIRDSDDDDEESNAHDSDNDEEYKGNHSKKVHKGNAGDEESEDDGDDDDPDDDDEESQDEIRIHRILASRSETRAKWREIGATMNSSEVTCGSVWTQPERENNKNPNDDEDGDNVVVEERFLVKWADYSYLHVSWETQADLLDQTSQAKTYLTTFFRKAQNGILLSQDDRKDGDYFDPGYTQIERILEVFYENEDHPKTWEEELTTTNQSFEIVLDPHDTERFEKGTGRQFLIKWEGLNYSDCSYEFERDLILADTEYKARLKEFYERTNKPTAAEWKDLKAKAERTRRECYKLFGDKSHTTSDVREEAVKKYQDDLAQHVFRNGGQLRDYQAEGVTWFLANFVNDRSCIMADEMGLVRQ